METAEIERLDQIAAQVSVFLDEQLGESATDVETYLTNKTVAISAANCLSPGELSLVQMVEDWKLLQEAKARQFEKVKHLLQQRIKNVTGCDVPFIHSVVGQDGKRFVFVTLG